MSEREKFEAWWERAHNNGNPPLFGWQHWRSGDGYLVDDDETEFQWRWEAWQASREALKAEKGEDSELLARAKKLEQEVGDIAERLNQSSDSGFMFVPVADLYELQLMSGSPYCYTASSSEAHGWAKEGYPIREYVLLDRLQDAMNHPIDTTPNQYNALGKGGEQ